MLTLIDKNYILFNNKMTFLSRYIYPNILNYYNNIKYKKDFNSSDNLIKENEDKDITNKKNQNINSKKNISFINIFEIPMKKDVVKYLNKIKINYNNSMFKFYLNDKRNKIIFYSSLIGLSFITINLGFYLKRKRFEKKIRKNLFNYFNEQISLNKINWEMVRPIIENIIKEKIKSSIIINPSMKDELTNLIINYLKNEKNNELIFELIKTLINITFSGIGMNMLGIYEIMKKNKIKINDTMGFISLINQQLEKGIINILKSKKFEDYISETFLNIINDTLCNYNFNNKINLV